MTLPEPEPWTERRVLDRLRERHAINRGNGPVWAYMEHVRDAAGFDAMTTIDALAMHLWPSQHFAMHAFEVKISRSDWRRELATPWKAGAWTGTVDYFWIVAPTGIVLREELPEKWGLLELAGPTGVFRTTRAAKRLIDRAGGGNTPQPDVKRSLVASMLRAAVRTEARRRR